MKAIAILLLAGALSGCSGLNVSWTFTASYNTNLHSMTQTGHATSPANEK